MTKAQELAKELENNNNGEGIEVSIDSGRVGYNKIWNVDFNSLANEITSGITRGQSVGIIYGLQVTDRVLRELTALALKNNDEATLKFMHQLGYVVEDKK